MRKQIEILIYQFKKQNNIDVYSALTEAQQRELIWKIDAVIDRVEFKKRTLELEEERTIGYYNV